ncbi:Asp-tRNA(Asn)/Glu-tRNA(Gln) amidotransferase subunit GatA [Bradymonas sediminis]|uniref:Glutamyl-tRNA(Gln) amidotransferase subunit A n=1 Tax=Bradymonas sediminis TaxID=1548548 RepID=A0A2Z4FLY0_9DELT|nr:Asp-tRNA(Asn)/Glu-tRNA(Gln) amidotransferase subunit GatA [Bradymonas sediminis]AWV89840.1 Asp-tRNA(Asn)/Glu-tRNA(Gln) amidotransferase GatCAB subunit A [Bradymonas sediminis]TDP76411.1 aspartyl/glutamyl-tRNA(Asn/Gln) amidotransferase subunit A [Bradymonas sediminis]
MKNLNELTIHQLIQSFESGEATAEGATSQVLDAIEAGAEYNAYISVFERDALLQKAREVDAARAAGKSAELGLLAGVPIAVKDNICTRVGKTTSGSKMLANFESPYDATVIQKLEAAGAIIVGKTNMDELSMGSSSETSYFGAVRNPHDIERVAGGSSGGSAAAVAANLCLASLGTDTGGSIRQPASHCGVVGVKPTYGRVSRYGVVAYASSLDQVGPMTRSVADAALMLEVLCGEDPLDATSSAREVPRFRDALGKGVKGLKIGIPKEYQSGEEGVDPQVLSRVREGIDRLVAAGAEVVPVTLPHTEYAIATYYLVAAAEASSNLARLDGARYGLRVEADNLSDMYNKSRAEGFGDEVTRRIILGTYVLSSGFYGQYYGKAQQVRTRIQRDFDAAFEEVDVLVAPVAPTAAFRIGEKSDDPLTMYLADIFTISANLAGIPAMSVPCGKTDEGLPVGLQILAPAFDEEMMLRVAAEVEQ